MTKNTDAFDLDLEARIETQNRSQRKSVRRKVERSIEADKLQPRTTCILLQKNTSGSTEDAAEAGGMSYRSRRHRAIEERIEEAYKFTEASKKNCRTLARGL